jgi:TPP-dependent pyruvate/acetoin dehydrogenase alpha subunit
MRDPVVRLRRWLEGEGWWDTDADQKLRADARIEV